MSIDHKNPWIGVDVNLFWDVKNIAFSHLKCNISTGRRWLTKNPSPEGMSWCSGCKQHLSVERFGEAPTQSSGRLYRAYCNDCRKLIGWKKT